MTIEEFCKQNKKKVHVSLLGNGKVIKEAESMLDENEKVLYAIVFKQFNILVVTTKRVFTCYNTAVGFRKKILYLKDITSVEEDKGGVFVSFAGGLIIKGITQNIDVSGITARAIVDEIRQIILKAKEDLEDSNSNNISSTKSLNYLEELEKLAELKEKGIISEEEFNSKKQQILESNK